jgi:hypothetical protein
MSSFEYFNPTNWGVTPEAYSEWWFYLISTLFYGFTAHIFASALLVMSMYALVVRRFGLTIILLILTLLVTYCGTLLK